ncbi:hypothetical protein PoB_000450700 [Plakobranchus ocellatus]|uniref:Uncharacterized protein n=1 Tax=Plakobranchus ocellatus TaxID=259542 RepID=A0AAV3Y5F0_9GAST|nr:hypothetical protein PoB_000450700 [Plakobranchus ocellatus]
MKLNLLRWLDLPKLFFEWLERKSMIPRSKALWRHGDFRSPLGLWLVSGVGARLIFKSLATTLTIALPNFQEARRHVADNEPAGKSGGILLSRVRVPPEMP